VITPTRSRAQVGLGQPCRRADRERQRALPVAFDIREGVDEDQHVRRALGMALGDEGLAAPGGRAPVHPPRMVARNPWAHVGKLEPVAARARAARAHGRLGARRRHERAQALDPRQDANGGLRRRGAGEPHSAQRAGGSHARAAHEVPAPARRADGDVDEAVVARHDAQHVRRGAGLGLEPGRQDDTQLEPLGAAVGADVVGDHRLVAFEQPLGYHRRPDAHPRVTGHRDARGRCDGEGGAEGAERGLAQHDGRERCRRPEDDPASEGR
jgi:hypothetical protein